MQHQLMQFRGPLKINIPLLGTGTGGLTAKVSYEVIKSEFGEDANVLLCVYAISTYMYNELLSEKVIEKDNRLKNPRVFISYTRTDKENERWVRNFVDRLRENGVNARLDTYHLKYGQDMLSRQEQNKYIAILRDSNIDKSSPVYIKSRYALDWSADEVSDEEFNELLLQLFNCDAEPPIGEIPDFIKEKLAR